MLNINWLWVDFCGYFFISRTGQISVYTSPATEYSPIRLRYRTPNVVVGYIRYFARQFPNDTQGRASMYTVFCRNSCGIYT